MIEEKVREILSFQKEQQDLLNKVRAEAEQIRQQAQDLSKKIIDEGMASFNERKEREIDSITSELEEMRNEMITRKKSELESLYTAYERFCSDLKGLLLKEIVQME